MLGEGRRQRATLRQSFSRPPRCSDQVRSPKSRPLSHGGASDKRGRFSTPRYPDSRRISIGNFQYLATAANAFGHAVKRLVLAIDWIVRIIHQVLLRGNLIGPRLAVADRCLPQQLIVRARRWRWCGWISRANRLRLRNSPRSIDRGQQRYRRDELSHDESLRVGTSSLSIHGSGETRPQGAQASRFVQMFQARRRAQESERQKQFSGTSQPTARTRTSDLRIGRNGRRAMSRRAGSQRRD
jgi:hypothetical protein